MYSSDFKRKLLSVSMLIAMGLSGCSNSRVGGETSQANRGLSYTIQSETTSESKPTDKNLSWISVLTYFDFDSAALSAKTTMVLDSAVNKFAKSPSTHVVIVGHTDERGTREYNLALGHRRASAVADYMVARGIDGSRIKKVSYGKERPLNKGSNEEAWSKNRRVEINDE